MMNLQRLVWLTGVVAVLGSLGSPQAWAQDNGEIDEANRRHVETVQPPIPPSTHSPAITVEEWLAQIAQADIVQITAVEITLTGDGANFSLAATAALLEPEISVVGNALIAEISNAVLALPEGREFQQANPAEGIALVSVTQLPDNRVRIAITGTDAVPEVAISTTAQGLSLVVNPGIAGEFTGEEAIQVVVTGEQEGYAPRSATTATRTDTPLRDIPQSIQVIPRQVIEDQGVVRLQDALRNVSGVQAGDTFGGSRDEFVIRGFRQFNTFRDGFRDSRNLFRDTANIEQIEVLKGPASVLFGNVEPGGIVNIITEQPISEPYYAFELRGGNFGFIRPEIDLSGPVLPDLSALYRLNLAYERSDGFRRFDQDIQRFFVAPTLAVELGDRTDLTLEFDYLWDKRPFDRGVVALGEGVANIPIDRILGEPNDFRQAEAWGAGYRLEHEFNDAWAIRNAFRYQRADTFDNRIDPNTLNEATGELTRFYSSNDDLREVYELQTNVVGSFDTGSVNHRLLAGLDLARQVDDGFNQSPADFVATSINIFAPVYGLVENRDITEVRFRDSQRRTNTLGLYLQDQIAIGDTIHLLVGGRYDIVDQLNINRLSGGNRTSQSDGAFSPRLGLVYQPIEPISLYASYSRSFAPNSGERVDGSLLEPERGTQYEAGIRGELWEGRLVANFAAYHLTKTNVATLDPDNPNFSIAVGEQRSQGLELDVAGEILPGWNVIASYSYTDAAVTRDNVIETGVRLPNVPYHSASLWTTYNIQQGNLQGLGFGLGLFFVGNRAGDLDNSYTLPSFLRTDAALYYRRDNWKAGLNLQNLLNVNYYTGVEFGRTSIAPGAPFTIIGSVSVDF